MRKVRYPIHPIDLAALIAVGLLVSAAACGSDSEPTVGAATNSTTSTTQTSPETTTTTSMQTESGGGGGTTTTSSSTSEPQDYCNGPCSVSFTNDVLPVLNDRGSCNATGLDPVGGCHGATEWMELGLPEVAAGFNTDDAKQTYDLLMQWPLPHPLEPNDGDYVVECKPEESLMLGNLALAPGHNNTHEPWGALMPPDQTEEEPPQPLEPSNLTEADLQMVTTWIICGAPFN